MVRWQYLDGIVGGRGDAGQTERDEDARPVWLVCSVRQVVWCELRSQVVWCSHLKGLSLGLPNFSQRLTMMQVTPRVTTIVR